MTRVFQRARKRIWVGTVILVAAAGCRPAPQPDHRTEPDPQVRDWLRDSAARVTISQGVWGEVWFLSGDPEDPRREPAERTVLVYQPTTLKDVAWVQTRWGAFIGTVKTAAVDSTVSDSSGFFQIALPPGEYSLFVREEGYYWANHWNTKGILANFKVAEGATTYFRVIIDYETRI